MKKKVTVLYQKRFYVPQKEDEILEYLEKICLPSDVSDGIRNVRNFQSNLKDNFRSVGVIFDQIDVHTLNSLDTFLKKHIPEKQIKEKVTKAFENILNTNNSFLFEKADVSSYKTKYYTAHLYIMKGSLEFIGPSKDYVVEVYRKMILASMNRTTDEKPLYHPLCEEFFLQIRESDKKQSTYMSEGFF